MVNWFGIGWGNYNWPWVWWVYGNPIPTPPPSNTPPVTPVPMQPDMPMQSNLTDTPPAALVTNPPPTPIQTPPVKPKVTNIKPTNVVTPWINQPGGMSDIEAMSTKPIKQTPITQSKEYLQTLSNNLKDKLKQQVQAGIPIDNAVRDDMFTQAVKDLGGNFDVNNPQAENIRKYVYDNALIWLQLGKDQAKTWDDYYGKTINQIERGQMITQIPSDEIAKRLVDGDLTYRDIRVLNATNPEKLKEISMLKRKYTVMKNANNIVSGGWDSTTTTIITPTMEETITENGNIVDTTIENVPTSTVPDAKGTLVEQYDAMLNTPEIKAARDALIPVNEQIKLLELEKSNLAQTIEWKVTDKALFNAIYRDEAAGIDDALSALYIKQGTLKGTYDMLEQDSKDRFNVHLKDLEMAQQAKKDASDAKQQEFQNMMLKAGYNLDLQKFNLSSMTSKIRMDDDTIFDPISNQFINVPSTSSNNYLEQGIQPTGNLQTVTYTTPSGKTITKQVDIITGNSLTTAIEAMETAGVPAVLWNAHRDEETQNQLYGSGRTSQELIAAWVDPKYANPSGAIKTWTTNSNHESGMAIDIYGGTQNGKLLPPSQKQIEIMNANGWYQDPALIKKWDVWHFDYRWTPQQQADQVYKGLSTDAKMLLDGQYDPTEMMKTVAGQEIIVPAMREIKEKWLKVVNTKTYNATTDAIIAIDNLLANEAWFTQAVWPAWIWFLWPVPFPTKVPFSSWTVWGTKARDFGNQFNNLISTLLTPKLQAMKWLGSMSDIEFDNIKSLAGQWLSLASTEAEFKKKLWELRASLVRWQEQSLNWGILSKTDNITYPTVTNVFPN